MLSYEKTYQQQSVLNSNPTKLVVKMYDLITQNCYLENGKKVNALLSELIHYLNFDYDLSAQLFEIYRFCQQLAKESKFDEIVEILITLRQTWEEVAEIEIKKIK